MRMISKEKSPHDYFRYFQDFIITKRPVLIWQAPQEGVQRQLYRGIILACRNQEDLIKIECIERNTQFELYDSKIFFYIEQSQIMFSANKKSIEKLILFADLPIELHRLNEPEHDKILQAFAKIDPRRKLEILRYQQRAKSYDFECLATQTQNYAFQVHGLENKKAGQDYVLASRRFIDENFEQQAQQSERDRLIFEEELSFVSLDEEDKMYASQRGSPRARPPEGKTVTMQLVNGKQSPGVFPLFDLSRGGLGILSFREDEYRAGDHVYIQGFDEKVLDQPMLAEVKSVRPADDLGIQFKIGMQFI